MGSASDTPDTFTVEEGKRINFDIPRLAKSNYIDHWDVATPIEGTNKAFLDVKEDCSVIAWIGANKYKLKHSVIGIDKIDIEVSGNRPETPGKDKVTDKWVSKNLPYISSSQEQTVELKGGDSVYFYFKPDNENMIDHWIITEIDGNNRTSKKDYKTAFYYKGTNEKYKEKFYKKSLTGIANNYEVKGVFRKYCLLNYKVLTVATTGTLEVKIERSGANIDISTLEKIFKTDLEGKTEKDDKGNPILLGYKVNFGDKITFTAKPEATHEVQEWDGFGYDTYNNPDPDAKGLTKVITVERDVDVTVKFMKK